MVLPAYAAAALDPLSTDGKRRETVLITGASSGIGLDLAKIFAANKFEVILTARSQARLDALARQLEKEHGVYAHVIVADLAEPEGPHQIFSEVTRRGLPVHNLVNNAGFGAYGEFRRTRLKDELQMVQVNISALTHLTKLALPGMLERNSGRIMNVASTAGFQPGPLMAVYYATKAYVISFSEAIANELKRTGVTVTCLCPGATVTDFAARAKMENSRLFKLGAMSSPAVAWAGYKGMMKGKTLVVPGVKNKLLAQSVRFSPRKMVTAIAGVLNAGNH
ncbi:MAG TPA: SDR family oxidoreductase [Alphaproteobacteria bacterium]|nr:SDR family oxidoreductase [Alphaproteobacteria bacterium]